MLSLDLFDSRYERQLREGAVDDLEARRIDDLNMRMLELLDRAKEPAYKKNPGALAGLKKQFQKIKAERDGYFKINPATGMNADQTLGTVKGRLDDGQVTPTATGLRHQANPGTYGGYEPDADPLARLDKHAVNRADKAIGVKFNREKKYQGGLDVDEAGIPGNVPTEKIPGKEDLLKGKGRSYYEDQKKNSDEVDEHGGGIGPQQRWQDLMPETVTDVKQLWAQAYHKLAPKIERHRDSFLAGQLYDELENYAELHGAEREFKQMMNGARNRAHMEYDTNPGGFHNWFWFLPFEDENVEEAISKKDLLGRLQKNLPKVTDPKNKDARPVAWTGPGKDDYGYTGYQGHGMPTDKQERARIRADKKKGVVESTDDIKKRMSKLEALALAANRAGDDAKCKMYQQKIQSLKQKLSQSMAEGWSDAIVSRRTGQPRTPYSVYIKGKKWKDFANDDHAEAVANKLRAKFKAEGRDPSVITVAPTDMSEAQATKTRLDPKCWTGKKIGNPKTKVKGGVRVNNCVPAESVNEDQDTSGVEQAILKRIMVAHKDLLMTYGPEKIMTAAEDVAYNVGDLDEIGTSDVSGWVNQVKQILGAVQEGLKDPADNPCWKGYKPVGTKKKAGNTVPNCVPVKEVSNNAQ